MSKKGRDAALPVLSGAADTALRRQVERRYIANSPGDYDRPWSGTIVIRLTTRHGHDYRYGEEIFLGDRNGTEETDHCSKQNKWSKGKVKDRANNAVVLDKRTL